MCQKLGGGGGLQNVIHFIIQREVLQTKHSNIEGKLTNETWIVGEKKKLTLLLGAADNAMGAVQLKGEVGVGWEAQGGKGFSIIRWVLARQENGGGYLRSEWCKQKYGSGHENVVREGAEHSASGER